MDLSSGLHARAMEHRGLLRTARYLTHLADAARKSNNKHQRIRHDLDHDRAHRASQRLERLHDVCVVRAAQISARVPVGVDTRLLGIALFEYCFAVPANHFGHRVYSAAQLKTMQEVITLAVFAVFSVLYLDEPLKWNHGVAFAFLVLAANFGVKKF